jgi:adenylate cyclase
VPTGAGTAAPVRHVDNAMPAPDTTVAMTAASESTVEGLQRWRAVVLHADVADYSRLMADDATTTVATMRRYRALVQQAVEDVGGTLVNFVGDSFLATFDDAQAGMRAAVRICSEVREHNSDVPPHRRAQFRLGLDVGEVVMADDGRYFGDALNIAARIQALADAGGINVSQAIYLELDEPELRLAALGPRRLKNIPEPVQVFRWSSPDGPIDRSASAGPQEPTVVVLPAHADDPEGHTVGGAVRVAMIDALGALPGVHVVDADAGIDSAEPQDVDGSYFIETSVVRSGTRVRVYVMLAEIEMVRRLWGGMWEGSTDDIFTLQDTLTAELTRAMEIELIVGQPALIYRRALAPEQRLAVYRGWYHLREGTPQDWYRAIQLFESVLDTDPDSVNGHSLLAFARWWGAVEGLSPDPARDLERAGEHARIGIEHDDPTGLSQLVAAALALYAGGDLDAALVDAETSLARRPTCDVSFGVLGSVRRYLGEWHAAVDACRQATRLNPQHMPWFATVQASAYYVGERYSDAIRLAERVTDGQPDNREALLVLAASQQALGLTRRARATAATLLEHHPNVRRDDLPRRHPFRDASVIARWSAHLAEAGVP